jgi:hypothetical protein
MYFSTLVSIPIFTPRASVTRCIPETPAVRTALATLNPKIGTTEIDPRFSAELIRS